MPDFSSFFGGGPSGGGGPGFSYAKFSFRDPNDVFTNTFRDSGGGGLFDEFLFNAARGSPGSASGARRPNRGSFGESGRSARQPTPEVTTVERPLPLSLEDLFNGVTKKMKIKRKTFDETGKRITTDTLLEVPIKPGLKKGSKIRFKGVGDQEEGGQQDLVFIVEEVSRLPSWRKETNERSDSGIVETTPSVHSGRRRSHPNGRPRPQGGTNRMETHSHYY